MTNIADKFLLALLVNAVMFWILSLGVLITHNRVVGALSLVCGLLLLWGIRIANTTSVLPVTKD